MKNLLIKNKHVIFSIAILFIATLIFWGDIVFMHKALFSDLTLRYYYPIAHFLSNACHTHQMPLWNPFSYCGMPFLANPQAGVFYPFNYLFVAFDYPIALTLFILTHTFLAGLFMFLLCMDMEMEYSGSLGAALLFMFNGFMVFRASLTSKPASIIWAPLIFLLFRRGVLRNSPVLLLTAALFLTIQFFGGHTQFFYYTLLLLLLYYGTRFLQPASVWPLVKKGIADFVLIAVAVVLLSAMQLLPAIQLALNSVRGNGINYSDATAYSIAPRDFFHFLCFPLWNRFYAHISGDIHIVGFYFGIVVLLLLGLTAFKRKTRREFLLIALIVFSGLTAMGKYLPLNKILFLFFPGWKYFRFPAQVMFFAAFGLSLYTGCCLDKIRKSYVKTVLIVAMFIELFLFGHKANIVIDTSYYGKETERISALKNDRDMFRYMLAPETRQLPPETSSDMVAFFLNYKDMLYPNIGTLYNLFDADGYETLRLKRFEDIQNRIRSPYSPVMDLLNVKYVLTERNIQNPKYELMRDGYVKIFANKSCLPRMYFLRQAKYLPDTKILDYMFSDEFDPRKEVVIETDTSGQFQNMTTAGGASSAPTILLDNYSINAMTLHLNNETPGWFVASEVLYPGWKARVDGLPVKLYRANYSFRAVPVSPGHHTIEFIFDPVLYKIGILISILSGLLMMSMIIVLHMRYHNCPVKFAGVPARAGTPMIKI